MMTPEECQFVFNALEEGADPNLENEAGMTPLFLVIINKRIDLVNELISKGANPNLIATYESFEMTPLFWAVKHNDDEAVKILLSKGANPNIPCVLNDQILTPLNLAIINNQLSLVELLASNNTDILHQVDYEGHTSLYYACLSGNAELVKYLIKLGANPYIDSQLAIIQNFIKYTYPAEVSTACELASDLYPECKIVVYFNVTILKFFRAIEIARDYGLPYLSGIFLNQIQIYVYNHASPLFRRVINNKLAELGYPTVKCPSQKRDRSWFDFSSSDSDSDSNSDSNSDDSSEEFSPLFVTPSPVDEQYAVYTIDGYTFDLYALLKWQTIRKIQYGLGETEDCIRYINPYTKVPFTSKDTTFIRMKAMSLGVELSFDPIVLSQACVKLHERMPINSFCKENNFSAIKLFLYGSNDVIDLPNASLVMSIAVKSGNFDLVKFLLELGISPDYSDAGYQPLINAAINGNIDIMKLLLQFGANPSVKYIYSDMSVMTPLYFAVTNENDPEGKMLKMLIKSGADVSEILDPEGRTALLWHAAFSGSLKKVKLLVKAGANVNEFNCEYPILQAAIMKSDNTVEKIQYLLTVGADPFAKNKAGEDALAFAKRMGRFEEIITQHLMKIVSRNAECAISDDESPIASRSATFVPLMNAASKSGMKLDVSNDDFIESVFGKSSVNCSHIKKS